MEMRQRANPDGSHFRLTIFKSKVTIRIIQLITQFAIDNLKLITLSLLMISKRHASSWQAGFHLKTDNVITFEYSGKPILTNGLRGIGRAWLVAGIGIT